MDRGAWQATVHRVAKDCLYTGPGCGHQSLRGSVRLPLDQQPVPGARLVRGTGHSLWPGPWEESSHAPWPHAEQFRAWATEPAPPRPAGCPRAGACVNSLPYIYLLSTHSVPVLGALPFDAGTLVGGRAVEAVEGDEF